jgi:hypothetical protein
VHTGFWKGDLREGDKFGDTGIDGRIILKWIFKTWDGGMNWIELAQDRDRWRALVNAVMNLRVHKMRGISSLAEKLLVSQEGLCSMELVSYNKVIARDM